MSASKPQLRETATRLRKQLALAEAKVEELRYKLARTDAQLAGDTPPISGLDLLWNEALPIQRTRSSKFQCRTEWNRIPLAERPAVTFAIAALKTWKKCEEWKIDGNSYAPALHRWIKNRQWENLPEITVVNPSARYSNPKKLEPLTEQSDEDKEAVAAFLASSVKDIIKGKLSKS